jgi:hypothetical protein
MENAAPGLLTQTTAGLIARLFEIRDEKKDLTSREKELTEEADGLNAELMRRMEEQGSTKVSSALGTAIFAETVVPTVKDWDEFYAWIKSTDSFHLLQRRVAAAAYREMLETGQTIPGVESFTQKTINLRAA